MHKYDITMHKNKCNYSYMKKVTATEMKFDPIL